MSLSVIKGDITQCTADAVVIPANPKPVIGNGLVKTLYNLADPEKLLEARRKIGELDFGDAEVTPAFNFQAKCFVHVVSPAWDGGNSGEEDLLRLCYERSLQCAIDNGCKSVVFPLLSTGVLRFPKDKAETIAISTIESFLKSHDLDVTLVLYENTAELNDIFDKIDRFIIENNYSNLDIDYYLQCEKDWADLPEDREEHQVLDLMRKQHARKLLDEKKRKIGATPYSNPFGFDMVAESPRIGYMGLINSIDDYIKTSPKRDSFSDVCNVISLEVHLNVIALF